MKNLYYMLLDVVRDFKERWDQQNPFKSLMSAINRGKLFLAETYSAGRTFTQDQKQRLLRQAIRNDNLNIFQTVLKNIAGDDKNFCFQDNIEFDEEGDGIDPPLVGKRKTSLLFTAIHEGSSTIAETLAKDLKTDFNYSGCLCWGYTQEALPPPIHFSCLQEMPAVTQTLIKRINMESPHLVLKQ